MTQKIQTGRGEADSRNASFLRFLPYALNISRRKPDALHVILHLNLGKLARGSTVHSTIRAEISLSKARTNFPRIYREEKSENESFDFRTLPFSLSLSLSSRLYALLCNRIVSLMFALFITDYSSTVFRHRSGKIADRLAAYAFRYSVQSRIIEREREIERIMEEEKKKKVFENFIEKYTYVA